VAASIGALEDAVAVATGNGGTEILPGGSPVRFATDASVAARNRVPYPHPMAPPTARRSMGSSERTKEQ